MFGIKPRHEMLGIFDIPGADRDIRCLPLKLPDSW